VAVTEAGRTRLGGIIPPIVTPFTRNGDLDYEVFRREVRHLLACGVHGLSPGGSTGEGAALTNDELGRIVQVAREEAGPALPVVAGVIRTSTHEAVRTALVARDAGADALMVTPVFYNVMVPDDAGNEQFYRTLSDDVGLPIVVYNVIPQNEIRPDLFLRLLDIEHVVGIKQSAGGVLGFYDMKQTVGERGLVFSATDEMLYSTFALGANGAISAILSLLPKSCVAMWDHTRAGNQEAARAIQDELFPVWKAVRGNQFPARMKAALAAMGRDCGYPRSPMVMPDEAHAARIAQLVSRVGEDRRT
jgi:dihydrodipicolinate synthase/N-acetylneuraminate lyase